MITVNALSEVAALMGDPARAAMLQLLMDGRAHTASELALTAGVTAQTASGHLSRMIDGNLLAARAQGRNRFYRLATPDVAHAIEALMAVAAPAPPASKSAAWRRDPDLRFCRTCYDHLAGQVGIAVTDQPDPRRPYRAQGPARLEAHGLGRAVLPAAGRRCAGRAPRRHRHFARQCLDWSERRPHISGALGAAIADTFFTRGWASGCAAAAPCG